MVYGINADNHLTVCTEELSGVQLFHQFVQRQVDNVFLSFFSNGEGYFVLRIEIGDICYLKRPEAVGSIDEKAGAVTSVFMLQGV